MQVGLDIVVVNQLAPYPHFEAWKPTIATAARDYAELAQPRGVRRVALRYINVVQFADLRVELEQFFTVAPRIPPAWDDEHGAFLIRIEKLVEPRLRLLMTFGSASPVPPNRSAALLDIYAIFEPESPINPLNAEDLASALDRGHNSIEGAFESSITDSLRVKFELETEE